MTFVSQLEITPKHSTLNGELHFLSRIQDEKVVQLKHRHIIVGKDVLHNSINMNGLTRIFLYLMRNELNNIF